MKNLARKSFLGLILAIFSLSAFATGPTVEPTREYEVEKTFDTDLNVVEFTPKGYPHMTCLYVEGGNDGGLTCFPKKQEESIPDA